jgi:hypothetical protein
MMDCSGEIRFRTRVGVANSWNSGAGAAGSSTAFVAKNAPNSAQTDRFFVMQEY